MYMFVTHLDDCYIIKGVEFHIYSESCFLNMRNDCLSLHDCVLFKKLIQFWNIHVL